MTKGRYKMGTISRLTGLSATLLRAWERRHGLLRPERGPGGHRLYTDDDLSVLRNVQKLMRENRSIGEIAALGRNTILALSAVPEPFETTVPPEGLGHDELDRRRREIVEAAVGLDAAGLNRTLDETAAKVSFPILIERVIEPAAREIGDLWQAGKCSVASEHLASSIFIYRLRKLIENAEPFPEESAHFAIAACLPGEEHQLGLLIVSYFLNRSGVRVLFLGPSLPFEDLHHACWASQPGAVLLSVTRKVTFRKERKRLTELLPQINRATRLYLGGSGAPEPDLEFEEIGLHLAPKDESAQQAAQRIARDLAAAELLTNT